MSKLNPEEEQPTTIKVPLDKNEMPNDVFSTGHAPGQESNTIEFGARPVAKGRSRFSYKDPYIKEEDKAMMEKG